MLTGHTRSSQVPYFRKFARTQVCKYLHKCAGTQVCKCASMQTTYICKYRTQMLKYTSVQVRKYLRCASRPMQEPAQLRKYMCKCVSAQIYASAQVLAQVSKIANAQYLRKFTSMQECASTQVHNYLLKCLRKCESTKVCK